MEPSWRAMATFRIPIFATVHRANDGRIIKNRIPSLSKLKRVELPQFVCDENRDLTNRIVKNVSKMARREPIEII